MNKQMLYFAYGSNLNRQQMESRCPGSKYIKNYYRKGYNRDYISEWFRWVELTGKYLKNKLN